MDCFQALNFNRQLEDLESWMDDIESQLSSEDHGKDIITVTHLLKKNLSLKEDLEKHEVKWRICMFHLCCVADM